MQQQQRHVTALYINDHSYILYKSGRFSADYNRHDSDLIPMDFTDYCPITGNSLDHSHATAKRLSVNRYHNPPIISLENEAALKKLDL